MKSWNPTGTLGTAISVDIPMTDPNGAAIYMVLHGSHQYTPVMVAFFSSTMDPSWDMIEWNGGNTQNSNAEKREKIHIETIGQWWFFILMILHIDSPLDLGFGLFSDQTIPILVGMSIFWHGHIYSRMTTFPWQSHEERWILLGFIWL